MASTPSCPSSLDNIFGPVVHECRSSFDFTLLFEQSILSIAPSAILLLIAPPRLFQLLRSSAKTLPNAYRWTKAFTALSLVGLQLALVTEWSKHTATRAAVPAAALSFLASLAVLGLSIFEHSRAVRPSSLLNVYLFGSLLFDITQARTLYLRKENGAILGIFTASIGIKAILLLLESRNKRSQLKPVFRAYPPEATSGIFNRSFFWWLNPLFLGGFRKILALEDLYHADPELLSEGLQDRMQIAWEKHRTDKRPFLYAILDCLKWPLLSALFPRLCLIGFSYAQPFLITTSIGYVSKVPEDQNKNDGYGIIVATLLIYAGIAISTVHYQHRVYRMVTMFRGAVATLIYEKTLTLPAGAYEEAAAVTLMSTDIDSLIMASIAANEIWARTIEVVIGVWLLERQLGWVCVLSVLTVVVSVMGASRIAKFSGPRQGIWIAAVQRRVAMTSSMLGAMKSVKMMGLASTLSSMLQASRVKELALSRQFRQLNVYRNTLSDVPNTMGPLLIFIIYAGQSAAEGASKLSTAQAFTSLAILSLLSAPAAELLLSIPQLASGTGSLGRIEKFLLSAVRQDRRSSDKIANPTREQAKGNGDIELQQLPKIQDTSIAVAVDGVSLRPSPTAPTVLQDIAFESKKASLTMIIGPVGCGKSLLLRAILGELDADQGRIYVSSKRMGYCGQNIWLQNGTIRTNICGISQDQDQDQQWYETVIQACAMDEDIAQLPQGSDTAIGSRGSKLSSGQKQRLALARMVYARQDIVILDDILSALDATTEEKLVLRLLGKSGLFQKLGTTVILATHALRHLSLADNIVVLNIKGRIAEQGSFARLRGEEGFISKLLLSGSKTPSEKEASVGGEKKKGPSPIIARLTKGPSPNDVADLSRKTGDISVYKYYFGSIGWKLGISVSLQILASQWFKSFPQLWLNWYTGGQVSSLAVFIVIFVVIEVLSLSFLYSTMHTMFLNVIPRSGAALHYKLLRTVITAPLSFFNETETGITLNRFSQDMILVDGPLPGALMLSAALLIGCFIQAALVAVGSNWMALTIPALVLAVYLIQKFYLRTSRQIRFLDLEAKSPLYSHFLETLEGLPVIRALGWQGAFTARNIQRLDISQRPYYLLYCIQRWLTLVLDLLVGTMAVIVVALAISLSGTTNGGRLGIALNAVLGFGSSLQTLMLFWTQLETSLGAIARIKSFEAATVSEDRAEESTVPAEAWPSKGTLEIRNLSASYSLEMAALRNVTLNIAAGEKIGICGRTGSGKSSLLLAIMRLLEIDTGTIVLDGVDLQTVPRELVRSKIIAIPQDPFILSGSVRLNADPISTCTDDAIIAALSKVHLWDNVLGARGGLDADLQASTLSQGQQQLFCLARAMLRAGVASSTAIGGAKVVVLDEATSNVDGETDGVMQKVIREAFEGWTIVTVAHRLETIRDADRVVVMKGGVVVEVGKPGELLEKEGSRFGELHRA
ncbi:hypothetical protein MMC25_003222 [Agyrium rufum]|nr:hypothetical protein [Agyrium rufum]